MTDRELEQRLRAWYAAEVAETESAPADLRETLATIPMTTRLPLRPLTRRRGFTLLAAAALLVAGGALVAGSGAVRLSPSVTPAPDVAVVPPTTPPTVAPSPPPPTLRPGSSIAFIRAVDKVRSCRFGQVTACPTARLWVTGSDGTGGHELLPDGMTNQSWLGWSSDGAHLLYFEDDATWLTDASGAAPRLADTGCVAPCVLDSELAVSADGTHIAFVREQAGDPVNTTTIATMDLDTGRVALLDATSAGGASPVWSPDGRQIAFFRFGGKDDGGPVAPLVSSIWIIDADGQGLHQISPTTLAAESPEWSPDGTRIAFVSRTGQQQDIYTFRPDGSDVLRLTSDGASSSPTWTADGRILFARSSAGSGPAAAGWWTMGADGSQATLLLSAAQIGVKPADVRSTEPVWQPLGGAALVAPPWAPQTATTVGPPAPTSSPPSPTPTPDLAPGYSWTAPAAAPDGTALGDTATRLDDGRVLVTAVCSTAAALYDPASGSFSPTGPMSEVRAAKTATLLHDGRVLIVGGSTCSAAGGPDGIWASAELYDPATGIFTPTGSMHTPRESQTATLLADGRVLIAGGMTGPSAAAATITLTSYRLAETDAASYLATAEIYDPLTGTFSTTGSMTMARRGHTATLLQDGRVLVVGNGGESSVSSKIADVYDPTTGQFTRTGSMKVGRWLQTATLLRDGRVLILGGRSPKDSVYTSAELYDPRSATFASAGSMGEGRQQHTATLLPDGRVLIAGGFWSDGQNWRVLSSTEMYDPSTGNFSPLGSMGSPRDGHTATLLDDGRVLFVGGEDIGPSGGVGVPSAVLYQP